MSPGDAIKEELRKREWGQEELARVMQRPIGRINEIIQGKQAITAEIAIQLASIFGNEAEEWMRLETNLRLAQAKSEPSADMENVKKRAKAYGVAPIKDMLKRGWIRPADSTDGLEREVLKFFGASNLDEIPAIHGAMRKSGESLSASPAQTAWAFRVRKLASAIPASAVASYEESRMESCRQELRKLAAYSSEVKKVPAVLASYGIRFVVVEGLPGAKMDGFATWLDENSPVIGMSLRYDRLDSFWFTLGHEWVHIKYRDVAPVDSSVGSGDDDLLDVKQPMERRADAEASAMFIDPEEMESFIRRVGPSYTAARINQFANTIKMHPSIIVGQLKHRGEILYSQHTKPIYPVREAIVKSSIADGWGKSLFPGALS